MTPSQVPQRAVHDAAPGWMPPKRYVPNADTAWKYMRSVNEGLRSSVGKKRRRSPFRTWPLPRPAGISAGQDTSTKKFAPIVVSPLARAFSSTRAHSSGCHPWRIRWPRGPGVGRGGCTADIERRQHDRTACQLPLAWLKDAGACCSVGSSRADLSQQRSWKRGRKSQSPLRPGVAKVWQCSPGHSSGSSCRLMTPRWPRQTRHTGALASRIRKSLASYSPGPSCGRPPKLTDLPPN